MSWEAFRSVAAMGSFFVALAALLISWSVWKTNRSTDLTRTIKEGDEKLSRRLDAIEIRIGEGQVQVERLEASVEHGIARDDIDKVHARVNSISREISTLSGELKSLTSLVERMDTYLRAQR
jgi:peptidoglycan hydrolase CwlO-like protein